MNLSIVRCLTLAAVTAAAGISAVALAQTPPQQPPATRPAGTQPGGRSFDAVRADLEAVGQQLQPLMADARIFTDPAVRKETGEKAVPLLRRLVNLMGEAAATAPIPQMADQIRLGQYQVRGLLMGFGEAQAKAELEQDASPTAKAVGRIPGRGTGRPSTWLY